MTTRYPNMNSLCCRIPILAIAAVCLCLAAPVHGAERFQPPVTLEIQARYEASAVQGIDPDTIWTVRFSQGLNRSTWTFERERGKPFCTIVADTSVRPAVYELLDARGGLLESSEGGILPVPGFPAPCQIFHIPSLDAGSSFKLVRLAGGRRFATTFGYDCRPVAQETALEMGWIDTKTPGYDPGKDLVMVTVTDSSGEIELIRQLWQEGAGWWLFQETGIGRFRQK